MFIDHDVGSFLFRVFGHAVKSPTAAPKEIRVDDLMPHKRLLFSLLSHEFFQRMGPLLWPSLGLFFSPLPGILPPKIGKSYLPLLMTTWSPASAQSKIDSDPGRISAFSYYSFRCWRRLPMLIVNRPSHLPIFYPSFTSWRMLNFHFPSASPATGLRMTRKIFVPFSNFFDKSRPISWKIFC